MAAARLGSVPVPTLRAIARAVARLESVSVAALSRGVIFVIHSHLASQAACRWQCPTGFGRRSGRIAIP